MSGLTPKDRDRLAQLEQVQHAVRHAHSLVEQFAATPKDAENMSGSLRRSFAQLKMRFTAIGFDRLAQLATGLETTARRGLSHGPKARALRDGLGSLTRQMEVERRTVVAQAQREPEKTE
jgi:hypothetical protein